MGLWKISGLFLLVVLVPLRPAEAAIEDDDWKEYLTRSCEPTIKGRAKKLLGDLKFWATSTSQWKVGQRT